MIIKIRKVYYCEYCKKHRLMPLLKHEKHCTSNPDRECKLCGRTESVRSLIAKYKKQCVVIEMSTSDSFNLSGLHVKEKPKIQDIIDDVNGCPNCILTIIKGLNISYPIELKFDYQRELSEWWNEKNEFDEYDY